MTANGSVATFTPLSAALAYARQGLRVFPLKPGAKEPDGALVPRGHLEATQNLERIGGWWASRPDDGVGISAKASGLLIVDVDPQHGGDESLADLEHEHGDFPATLQVETGRGGSHYYFRRPADLPVTNLAGSNALWHGVDLIGAGYAVAPPSIHPDTGKAYVWVIGHEPGQIELADPPTWLADAIRQAVGARGERTNGAISAHADTAIPEGQRNTTLTALAGAMRGRGMTGEAIREALRIENETRCNPPLPKTEIDQIARSIGRYRPDNVGGRFQWVWGVLAVGGTEARDLPTRAKWILVYLAAYANADGYAWPSIRTLADAAGVSARTVATALAELVKAGLIRRVRRGGGPGNERRSGLWQIRVPTQARFPIARNTEHLQTLAGVRPPTPSRAGAPTPSRAGAPTPSRAGMVIPDSLLSAIPCKSFDADLQEFARDADWDRP